MAKIRVHELAKEFGISSKEMASRIKDMGYPIKNYMSTLEDYEADEIRKRMKEEGAGSKEGAEAEQPKTQTIIRRRRNVVKIKKIVIKKTGKPEEEAEKPEQPAEEQAEAAEAKTPESPLKPAETKAEEAPEKSIEPEETTGPEGKEQPETAKKRAAESKVRIVKPAEREPGQETVTPEEAAEEAREPFAEKKAVLEVVEPEEAPEEAPPEDVREKEALEKAPEEKPLKEEGLKKEAEVETATAKKGPETVAKGAETAAPAEQKAAAPKAKKPKQLVKIVDRKIDISKHLEAKAKAPARSKAAPRPAAKPGRKPMPAEPAAPVSEAVPLKGKKKGKRVVKAADLSMGKRRKPVKKKGRKETIQQILAEEAGISRVGKKSAKAKAREAREQQPAGTAPIKAEKRKIVMTDTIQVSEFAKKMGVKLSDIIMKLMGLGVMVTANQTIDYDTAVIVASEFGYEVERKSVAEDIVQEVEEKAPAGEPVPRPPVVTVMGHVDHGKTTLLDAIRDSDVAAREAGGITQHIGAYQVELPSGDKVTFIDTPGHEAFTSMRARGAQVTDIIILVVAADDGVMAQTREAIDHARAAKVPLIVAVNKIDKPGANPDRVKTELSELGLVPEDWGGDTIFVNISAKKKIGIDELLELMILQAEVLELQADPKRPARGHVIESRLDKGRGPVATVIVQEGTLKVGDALVCGLHYGKVRAMINDKGEKVSEAGPSTPVEIQGLSGVPEAGNEFIVLPNEKKAREVAEYRQRKAREAELAKTTRASLENLFEKIQQEKLKTLHLIIKADVQGSLEALSDALRKLSTDKIKIDIVRGGIGAITESDVLLASASDAIIIGFNVKPTPKAKQLAEQEHVEIRFYDVIYHALEEIKSAMVGMLEPVYKEVALGKAEVRETFRISKVGTIAGCYVIEGVIRRNAQCRLLRDNVVVYTGKIASLRRFKDDVKEVQSGYECGIGLENFNDIKVGDVIEAYEMEEVAPDLGLTEEEQENQKQE